MGRLQQGLSCIQHSTQALGAQHSALSTQHPTVSSGMALIIAIVHCLTFCPIISNLLTATIMYLTYSRAASGYQGSRHDASQHLLFFSLLSFSHTADAVSSDLSHIQLMLSQVNLGGGPSVGGFQQCLQFSGSAVLNPVQYLNGLAEAFVAKGGQIFEQTRVRKPDTHHVTTMAGNKVTHHLPWVTR